ncbi:thioester reductase domain-containing protein [Rhodococcus pyridinivorans]|uniref:thioester reductase domain-containing protein n=2 Tax=Nocardiaceae TaxID=85025 RepID=UPI0009EE4ECA|nr:thioester reductase domain-containing protein [Rhodococcus sp. 852002-51564_SCH6189132-a]MCW3470018.1 thioester reductase domain-containing protein [Rhodococcus pyridinivorans]
MNTTAVSTMPTGTVGNTKLINDVRQHIATLLPPGVVPSKYVVLEEFPRLPNGKTDRSRLPAPITAPVAAKIEHVSPRTELERTVATVWNEILGLGAEDVDIDTPFSELGGSSLSMMQMAARVKLVTGQRVDVRKFIAAPTIRSLSAELSGTTPSTTIVRPLHYADEHTMRTDAQLPDDIKPEFDRDISRESRNVLLTGGTGYTGAFLLRELLDRSSATVTVLARGARPADVVQRVVANLAEYELNRPGDEDRIAGVPGDVSRPYLGMRPDDYARAAADSDVIIHNAADSRWTTSYSEVKVTNVLGTLEVLRLARTGGNTPVHYVGSTGSLPTKPGTSVWHEQANDDLDGVLGGYRQTKWVSDQLMHQARERGMRVTVFRPGALVGAQSTGACSTETFINHLIRGWVGLGCAMRYDLQVEMVPIDYFARVVAHIALDAREPQTYHVLGTAPVMMDDVLDHLLAYGYDLESLDYAEWYARLLAAADRGEDNDLVPYLPLFSPDAPGLEIGLAGNSPRFVDDNLVAALAGSDVRQLLLTREVMFTYLDYFVRTGFLPPPPDRSGASPFTESENAR